MFTDWQWLCLMGANCGAMWLVWDRAERMKTELGELTLGEVERRVERIMAVFMVLRLIHVGCLAGLTIEMAGRLWG